MAAYITVGAKTTHGGEVITGYHIVRITAFLSLAKVTRSFAENAKS